MTDREAETILPPAPEPEKRDTMRPHETALADHVAALVITALGQRFDALDKGVGLALTRIEELDARLDRRDVELKRELANIHEQLGRVVVREDSIKSAVATLADQMLVNKYINDKARGEVADLLAMQPKAAGGNEPKGAG